MKARSRRLRKLVEKHRNDTQSGAAVIAAALGVSQNVVNMWVVRGRPSDTYAVRFAALLGVPVATLRPDLARIAKEIGAV